MNNDNKAIAALNCWASYATIGSLFSFEIIAFPTMLPSFEDAIFDSKLESVGPTLSNLVLRARDPLGQGTKGSGIIQLIIASDWLGRNVAI